MGWVDFFNMQQKENGKKSAPNWKKPQFHVTHSSAYTRKWSFGDGDNCMFWMWFFFSFYILFALVSVTSFVVSIHIINGVLCDILTFLHKLKRICRAQIIFMFQYLLISYGLLFMTFFLFACSLSLCPVCLPIFRCSISNFYLFERIKAVALCSCALFRSIEKVIFCRAF